jgi:hypothetical protein
MELERARIFKIFAHLLTHSKPFVLDHSRKLNSKVDLVYDSVPREAQLKRVQVASAGIREDLDLCASLGTRYGLKEFILQHWTERHAKNEA